MSEVYADDFEPCCRGCVRHEWLQTHYVLNGYPSGTGIGSDHKYVCDDCGRELRLRSDAKTLEAQ